MESRYFCTAVRICGVGVRCYACKMNTMVQQTETEERFVLFTKKKKWFEEN